MLIASEGGWAVIGVEDVETLETIATTDTIWIMEGPTKVGKEGVVCSPPATPYSQPAAYG